MFESQHQIFCNPFGPVSWFFVVVFVFLFRHIKNMVEWSVVSDWVVDLVSDSSKMLVPNPSNRVSDIVLVTGKPELALFANDVEDVARYVC